jgi:hypothetical protein
LPWHKRGVRVHRFVYRGWYVAQLLLGGFILVSAVAPAIRLALDAIASSLEIILTAIAAAVTGLIGALLVWIAIHRLRNPIRPMP